MSSDNEFRKGRVYVQNRYAGVIEETEDGYRFTYDPEYLEQEKPLPICINMPCKKECYESESLFPFFDGLIPEGWLLDVSAKNWKIDSEDRFGLLMVCCEDCIGDVTVSGGCG